MKALFEKVVFGEQNSILVSQFRMPYFDAPWHYHPEYELTYIANGCGQRFVGDHVEFFDTGDLVLIGPDLPHFWRSDEEFYQPKSGRQSESIVVQFPAIFVQQSLLMLPEATSIRKLFDRSRYGVHFGKPVSQLMAPLLNELTGQSGFVQILQLLSILNHLALVSNTRMLASDGYQLVSGTAETERMKLILEYILTNFRTEIRVEQIASVASMAPASFCRYFKNRTRKTFVEYLNELRISHARKLLSQMDLTVGQIGLECGFSNSSHFHKQFKLHTGLTPFRYQALARGGKRPY